MKALNLLLLSIAAVALTAMFVKRLDPADPRVVDGMAAVQLFGLSGEPRPLPQARPLVIGVFSPECEVCDAAGPSWVALSDSLKQRGIQFAVLSFVSEDTARIRDHLTRFPFASDVLLADAEELGSETGIRLVPTVLVLDSASRIAFVRQGFTLTPPAIDSIVGVAEGG